MRRSCDTLSADSEQGNCFVTAITAPMRELHTPVEDFEKERSYFTMIEGKGVFFFLILGSFRDRCSTLNGITRYLNKKLDLGKSRKLPASPLRSRTKH